MTQTLPYGSWPSPITAADVARGTRSLSYPGVVAGPEGLAVWWVEGRPENDGRYALVGRLLDGGSVADVLPAAWNPRSRIIEYGARPWVAIPGGGVVFTFWDDQRLYLKPADAQPHPLTVAPDDATEHRYGEPIVSPDGQSVWAVRETHRAGEVSRAVVSVPLDGSAADDDDSVHVLADGHDFFAAPVASPDGQRLAYIAWDHPRMPWDGTTLCVVDLARGQAPRALIGGEDESVLNPLWADDGSLYCLTDRTGWWLPHRVDVGTASATPLVERDEEFGQALWELGLTTMQPLDDGRLVVLHGRGEAQMSLLDPVTGDLEPVAAGLGWHEELGVHGQHVAGVAGSATTPNTVVVVNAADSSVSPLRASTDHVPDARYLSESHPETFPSVNGRVVHAHVYPPHNGDCVAPTGEHPPYLAFVHGGPTSHVAPGLSLMKAYFTSRGIGVIDVNYGGSTGYGRAYRNLLRGQWGVVDVEDTVAAVRALADRGDADSARLGIRGGSAGGWTTLAALATSTAFGAGAAYFPVTDLIPFAEDTHDFESRYLDTLVGPLPEAHALYVERSPMSHLDTLDAPVLLLQGDDDKIVPPSQPQAVADALAAKGVPHAYLLFAGEQHGFRKAENIITALEAELSFFGQVFGFDPPGVPRLTLQ